MLQPAKSGVLFAKHNDGVGRNAGGKHMLGVAGDAGWVAVAPMRINFVLPALLPIVQLAF